jgi:hypothetical protein
VGGWLGAAWNLPAPLAIEQSGAPALRLRARWATRPFELPLYWALRIERATGPDAWVLDLVHHKLHLQNPTAEVPEFSVTHGHNLLMLARTRESGGFVRGVGLGIVIAHPENTVRGRKLDERRGILGAGYHVSGPVVGALAGRRFDWGARWRASLETRFTAAWSRMPVAGGSASLPNVAVHGLLGAEYRP